MQKLKKITLGITIATAVFGLYAAYVIFLQPSEFSGRVYIER